MSGSAQTTILNEHAASSPPTTLSPECGTVVGEIKLRGSFRYFCQIALTALPLFIADFTAVFVGVCLSYGIVSLVVESVALQPLLIALQAAGSMVLVSLLQRSYPGCGIHPVIELKNGVIATCATFALLVGANFTRLDSFADASMLLGAFVLALLLVPLCKSLARSLCARFSWWGFPALVFSSADDEGVLKKLAANRRMGIRAIGIIAEPHSVWQQEPVEADLFLGAPEEAAAIADERGIYWAVISGPDLSTGQTDWQQNVEAQLAVFPRVLVLSNDFEMPSLWRQSADLNGTPATLFESKLMLRSARLLKRACDLVICLFVSLFCLPLIAVLALAVKCTSAGPAFYAHRRLGRNGKSFRAWKLRSMYMNADQLLAKYLDSDASLKKEWELTHKLKSDPRITRIGRLLRATSLDELPQIWNVLRGEMSLVGPRPIVDEEIPKYRDKYQLYSKVTPGVTGLWQISGRNHTTYEERVAYDAYYVRNWSLWLDLYILTRTIKVVLLRDGAF